MKYKYGIGLFVLFIVIFYLSFYTVLGSTEKKTEQQETEESVTTDGEIFKEDCYYLHERNGYVVVYKNDHKTIFEYTDIIYEELPEHLQTEIKNGKYVKDLDELYGFLENYSS